MAKRDGKGDLRRRVFQNRRRGSRVDGVFDVYITLNFNMAHFSAVELEALDRLQFDEKALPYFDPMRWGLRWFDEDPPGIGGEAYERLLDLVIVRRYLHEGRKREDWHSLGPTSYFAEVWDEALKGAPNWPGFKRIALSNADKDFWEQERHRPLEDYVS